MRALSKWGLVTIIVVTTLLATAPLAGASPHTTRITGTYDLVVTWPPASPVDLTLHLMRGGTCTLRPLPTRHHNSCAWTAGAKGSVDFVVSNPAFPTATYTGVRTPTGLNSATFPGSATNTAGAVGTWYGTRA